MRMTEVKTIQQGVVHTNNQLYVLHDAGNVVLLQFDIFGNRIESAIAEPWLSMHGVWVSPSQDCLTSDMSLFVFPEFDKHSVFSVSVINSGRSVSVCLVKGDVFDLK